MRVKIAEHAGFCMGVNRAFRLTEKLLQNNKNVYALGEIVHNRSVKEYFEKKGLKITDNLNKLKKDSILIIRAHGIPDTLRNKIQKKKIKYFDATCPYVTKFKLMAEKLEKEGYLILIFGDKEHAELKTIISNIKNYKILSTVKEFESLPSRISKKIGLISQTTQSIELFKKVIEILVDKTYELRIFNTICDATKLRQISAKELAQKVDLMIVLGSGNSANTNRLYKLCKQINPDTIRIDNISQMDKRLLKGKKTVGITAGASTPQWIIDEAYNFLKRYKSN